METKKHLSLRIEHTMLKKFKFVCAYYGRSANNQLIYIIRENISSFENEHGKIDIDTIL